LGNFPIFTHSGCLDDDINNCDFPKTLRARKRINGSVIATPGYFTITLNTSIKAEMTVTNHTALYRFTYPAANSSNSSLPLSPVILADLSDLPDSRMNASISVDPETGRIMGNGSFSPSFGIGAYNAFFCADFSGAPIRNTGVFNNNRAGTSSKSIRTVVDGIDSPPLPAGSYVQFSAPTNAQNQILARVGVSFISSAQACSNAEKEIPAFDFDGVKQSAEDAWCKKFSVISVDADEVDDEIQTVFWSGMYRAMLSPQDYTNENPLWKSSEPCAYLTTLWVRSSLLTCDRL
jgi:putative alpha-1,2-mannosidase